MKPTDKTQKKSEIESAASGELKKQINEIDEKIDSTEKKDIQHQIDDIESQIKKEEQKNKNLNKELDSTSKKIAQQEEDQENNLTQLSLKTGKLQISDQAVSLVKVKSLVKEKVKAMSKAK